MAGRLTRARLCALLAESLLAVAVGLRSSATVGAGGYEYDYSHHGLNWIDGMCANRERQSPINFDDLGPPTTDKRMQYTYQIVKSSFEIANNGRTISADFAGLGYGGMIYEDSWYNFMNINLHALSEHTFKGVHYPLELHMVHKKYDTEDLLIVAIPITHVNQTISLLQWQDEQKKKRQVSGSNRTAQRLRGAPAVATQPGALPQSLGGMSSQVAAEALANAGLTEQSLEAMAENAALNKEKPKCDGWPCKGCGKGCTKTATADYGYPEKLGAKFEVHPEAVDEYEEPREEEPNFNPTIQHFLRRPPPILNTKEVMPVDELAPLDLNLLIEGGTYLEYAGSMTAPPCAEVATWMVRRDPIKASEQQVKILTDAIYQMSADFGNWRATMPMNGRFVDIRTPVKIRAPDQKFPAPISPLKGSDRVYNAMKVGRQAVHLSKVTVDYIHNMDMKMQAAAKAHVSALAPDLYPDYTTLPPTRARVVEKENVVDMTKTAEKLAHAIAGAAKDAISDAAHQIAEQAETAAKDAASEAAVMATESMNMPTTPPPLNLPTIPPIGGPAFAAAVGIPPAPAPLPPAPPAAAPGAPGGEEDADENAEEVDFVQVRPVVSNRHA